MNWRAITSTVGQACLSVYHATREILNVTREALSPQGMERSSEALQQASLSYLRDLQAHPLAIIQPLTLAIAPADIFSRLKTRDQQRILIQAGFFGLPALIPGVSPLSPLLAGARSFLLLEGEVNEGERVFFQSARQILPLANQNPILLSPGGTPPLQNFRAGN